MTSIKKQYIFIESNDACKELGAEPPQFELIGYGLRVYFKALESALFDEDLMYQNEALNEALNDETDRQIVLLIKNNPKISQKGIINKLGISRATVQRKMEELKTANIIERIGSKKTGHWVVKNNTEHNS